MLWQKILLSFTLAFLSFSWAENLSKEYQQEIQEWKAKRQDSLKKNWLSLAGLHWLKEGRNTLGTAKENDLVLEATMPAGELGYFIVEDGRVHFYASTKAEIYHGDNRVYDLQVFPSGTRITLSHKKLEWFVIQRGEQLGVRVRDHARPEIAQLKEIPSFAIQNGWKLNAKFIPFAEPKKLDILNILGQTNGMTASGYLVFVVAGKEYTLHPIDSGDSFFIMFTDKTTNKETYSVGRYLNVTKPVGTDEVILDFNKAYNPPCAYTHFATCPLPPQENELPIRVTAGEKYSKSNH